MSADYEITYLGDTVRITTYWYNWSNALVDLSSSSIKVYSPSGTLLGTYTTPTNDGTGTYHYDYTVPSTPAGSYLCVWTGTYTDASVKTCAIVIPANDPTKT